MNEQKGLAYCEKPYFCMHEKRRFFVQANASHIGWWSTGQNDARQMSAMGFVYQGS